MLNKRVCRKCYIEKWRKITPYRSNLALWLLNLRKEWKEKKICRCNYYPWDVSIDGEVPEGCPYLLEHLVNVE
jgi:hypothetical protein